MVGPKLTLALAVACLFILPCLASRALAEVPAADQPVSLLNVATGGAAAGTSLAGEHGMGLIPDAFDFRQCFGQQALLADALTRYNLENNTSSENLTPALLAQMVRDGYLPWALEDPFCGQDSAKNYRLTREGNLVCVVHGTRRLMTADEDNEREECYQVQRAMAPYVKRSVALPEALRARARARMNGGSPAPVKFDQPKGCQYGVISERRAVTCLLHGADERPIAWYAGAPSVPAGR